MEQNTIALLAIAAALLIALASPRITNWYNKRRDLRSAVLIFKEAFAPEINAVSDRKCYLDTFSSAFDRHKSAVDNIRPILPECYRKKLQKAWDDYQGKNNNMGFDERYFVSTWSASFLSQKNTEGDKMYKDFHVWFKNLHSCLDDLL